MCRITGRHGVWREYRCQAFNDVPSFPGREAYKRLAWLDLVPLTRSKPSPAVV